MAQSIKRKHKLGKTIQDSNFGQGYAWLFEGEGDPSTGTAAELQKLNDINAPIGSKFTDLATGESYIKIDSTPDESRGAYKVGVWKLGSGGTQVDNDQTGDFAPVGADNTKYRIDSVSDVTITINEDSCGIGGFIEFQQMGAGQIIVAQGNVVFNADVYTSFKTASRYSTIKFFHDAVGEFSVSGQIE